jgi:mono/diheme cytochrome c family protein
MTTNRLFAPILSMTLAASVVTLLFATPARAQSADATYSQNCAACHGAKGLGDGPAGKYLKPPPSDFATSLKGKTDDWIAKAIKGGGAAIGESPTMPAYASLSDDQIKALVAYIKSLNP